MRTNPGRWFEIYVKDISRAKEFYESVLETKLEKLNTPNLEYWAFPTEKTAMGIGGALVKMEGFNPTGNSTVMYFGSADCAIEAKRVVQYGGKIEHEKMSIGEYGFIAIGYDTEGNMIGFHSME